MARPRTDVLAWSLFALSMVVISGSAVFLVLALGAPQPAGAFGFPGFSSIYGLAFAIVGLLIALRQPRNPLGWLFLVFGGFLAGFQQLAQQYATYNVLGHGTMPGGDVGAWLEDWLWLPQMAMLGIALLLIPDGHLTHARWRYVAWIVVVAMTVAAVGRTLAPGPIGSFQQVDNPFGIAGDHALLTALYPIGLSFAIGALVASTVSLWQRRQRSRGDERVQVRWIVLGASVVTVTFVLYEIAYAIQPKSLAVNVLELTFVVAVIGFAASFGISILRYRLFDIDVVVSRAVVFGLLAAFITAVYVALVVGVGTFAGSQGDAFLSALAAATVAIAFQPARRRAEHLANRLIYGDRASPYEVLSGFSQRVAGAYGAEDVPLRMARILAEGTGASRAEVWMRVGRELELAAAWPDADGHPRSVAIREDELPELEGASTSVPVRHEGELLGALAVTKPPSDPLSPTEERLIDDLAKQAGLVLRNAALIADLRASRQRLVSAQDEERRRLERNLHDGAQQQLVALSVKLGLLKRTAGTLPAGTETMIEQLQGETQDAIETLRDLARGIYPPLLADQGLTVALQAQARKAPLPVEVRADGVERYPQAVEAAVYFSCLEALQNVAKYANASRATVRLVQVGGVLTFDVTDDGAGFDVDASPGGTGLQGIHDRLAALDGALDVRSAPGAGTTLAGRISVE